MTENNGYHSYDFDYLTEGSKIKLEHSIYVDETDMSDLVSKPIDKLQAMRDGSVAKEKTAFEKVRQAAQNWEKQAAVTRQYDRAIEYLKVPEVEHSSNKWVKAKDEFDYNHISNRVYKMSYRIYERSSYRTDAKKYDVRWDIYTNRPQSQSSYRVAGQERVCSTREEAEKYIQGRIKAYSHLFTEISPPIPKELEKSFMVYGQLLPGYITEEMQKAQEAEKPKVAEKPSVRKQLAALKAQEKSNTPPEQTKTHSAPEL